MKKTLFTLFLLLIVIAGEPFLRWAYQLTGYYPNTKFNPFSICLSENASPTQKEPLKPLDVSGQWTLHFKGIEYECLDPAENGPKEGSFIFQVEQQGDNLTATFKDGKTTNHLTGKLRGTVITATVHGVYPENCRVVTDIVGEVLDREIRGTYSGKEINCEVCKWEGDFTVKIGP